MNVLLHCWTTARGLAKPKEKNLSVALKVPLSCPELTEAQTNHYHHYFDFLMIASKGLQHSTVFKPYWPCATGINFLLHCRTTARGLAKEKDLPFALPNHESCSGNASYVKCLAMAVHRRKMGGSERVKESWTQKHVPVFATTNQTFVHNAFLSLRNLCAWNHDTSPRPTTDSLPTSHNRDLFYPEGHISLRPPLLTLPLYCLVCPIVSLSCFRV